MDENSDRGTEDSDHLHVQDEQQSPSDYELESSADRRIGDAAVETVGVPMKHSVEHSHASSSMSFPGKLFVGKLSWNTTEETLANYFGKFGEVVDAVIKRERMSGQPRGFGFVTFAPSADVKNVLEQEHVIDDVKVNVGRPGHREDTRRIFVGGLPPHLEQDELKNYFCGYGDIIKHRIIYDHHTGDSRGFGFITFQTRDSVDRLFSEEKVHELGGKQVDIGMAAYAGNSIVNAAADTSMAVPDPREIFVGGLPQLLKEEELKNYFSVYGEVIKHHIIYDHQTGSSKGFGFITFQTKDSVDRLLSEEKDHELWGKQVDIRRAQPKSRGIDSSFRSNVASGKYDQENRYGGKVHEDYNTYSGYGGYGGYGGNEAYAGNAMVNAPGVYGYGGGYGYGPHGYEDQMFNLGYGAGGSSNMGGGNGGNGGSNNMGGGYGYGYGPHGYGDQMFNLGYGAGGSSNMGGGNGGSSNMSGGYGYGYGYGPYGYGPHGYGDQMFNLGYGPYGAGGSSNMGVGNGGSSNMGGGNGGSAATAYGGGNAHGNENSGSSSGRGNGTNGSGPDRNHH